MKIESISLRSSTSSYSIVTLIWKRSATLLYRLLATLSLQTLPPAEIIVSDNNPDDDEAATIKELCDGFPLARYIHTPMDEFHASRGVNIGIKATWPDADYVAVCGSEMLYSENYLAELDKVMTPEHFTHMLCGTMQDVAISADPHREWDRLCKAIVPKSNTVISPGTFMCASRDWWFKVRGSDEGIYFLLFDVDFVHRANLSGLEKLWLPWDVAQALHQYHPPSPLFYSSRGKWYPQVLGDKSIVRNSESWGV